MTMDPYAKTTRDGKTVDNLTDYALRRAEKRLGRKINVTQGSYNVGGVAASAGTHDGGGVVDCPAWEVEATVTALRAVGFAAWFRPAIPGLWSAHIHAVLIGHGRLSTAAKFQTLAYLNRRDGLKSNLADTQPGWTNITRYTTDSYRADLRRESIDARVTEKRSTIAALRERIKVLLAKRKTLPK